MPTDGTVQGPGLRLVDVQENICKLKLDSARTLSRDLFGWRVSIRNERLLAYCNDLVYLVDKNDKSKKLPMTFFTYYIYYLYAKINAKGKMVVTMSHDQLLDNPL